jgi:hypothetical protein
LGVTISLRRFSLPLVLRFASNRRSSLAAVSALVLSTALLGTAAPATAVVTTVGSASVGLQPRNTETVREAEAAAEFENPQGNSVLHSVKAYAIYWDPTASYFGDWQEEINKFFQAVGADTESLGDVFAVDTQYTDKTNKPAAGKFTFFGAYTDTHKYPAAACVDPAPLSLGAKTCLTDSQIQEELTSFIAQHSLQKGMGAIFYLLTPPGVTVCLDKAATSCSDYEATPESYEKSFCSYHSDINPGGLSTGDANTVLYAAIPWTAHGLGNYHLADEVQAYDCQDGGFDPSSKPFVEKKEKAKEITEKEQEDFEKGTPEQKNATLEARAHEGPHQQEPNQKGKGPDGSPDVGLADLIINQVAVEQQNTVTNPLLNAWHDSAKRELTDECRNFFASSDDLALGGSVAENEETYAGTLYNQTINTIHYYLNNGFNLAALRLPYPGVACLGGVNLFPKFTAPNPVKIGEVVSFDGMESNISLNAAFRYSAGGTPEANYATYAWNFGDGSPEVSGFAPGAPACEAPWLSPCAASEFHAYSYGGTYEVKLTVTDVGGNISSITHPITVEGPPPPPPPVVVPVPGTPGTPGGSGGSGGAGSGSGTPGVVVVPNPVAAAAVISRSLKTVLRKGLVVRYSVNEQVAGRFEVLLDRATARRLKISGPPALNLAAGSPPEVVIAKAILVTTKGGRSSVSIKFSKRTAARLAHAHKVKLQLRLIVRNASASSPASTTVISSFTLGH